ncbi:carbohydrate ABC transporter permease [Enterococcus sp. JM9B]|uniref:carbohydrate ABC transporter permease n=1 Tax=Enterococcus sp. JM9B TaxID=1857216 RepID=UPI0013750FF7|nr:carbohydrate ABC transporter permease [Enterococcus sp. JM9B]KAF1303131.1 ABC transporter permease [Enterococcus sp. JM9B]
MKKQKIGAFDIVNISIFILLALICIFPFYYIFINSISANDLVANGAISFLPKHVHFNNYLEVFKIQGLFPAFLVSIARTVVGTFFSVISAAFLGYALTKQEFWLRKFWYRFVIITMYLSAGVIPAYLNIKNLGLLNSFWVYVLPALASPFNMILAKTYIESIPPSLEESAELDGASYLKRFFYVVLPIAKPIIATIAIFAAVGQWNSFMDTVMYMTKNNYYTLQYILYKYLNEVNTLAQMMQSNSSNMVSSAQLTLTPASIRYTITAVTVLPILLVYPFFQRYIVKGVMIGAVKG